MGMNNVYKQYQQNSVMTASPEELTLMLYNGAIKFINLAKHHLQEKNMEKVHNAIIRAQDIINELNITLNMDYEISQNLRSLYTFMLEKLMEANIQKNADILDEILPLVEDMRDTWKQAMQEARKLKYGSR